MTESTIEDEQVGMSCPAEKAGRARLLGLPTEQPTIMSVTPQLARLIDTDVDPDVKLIYAELVREFPQITHVYGGSNSPDHNNKRCLDLMVVDLSGAYVKARGMTNLSWGGQRDLGERIVAYLKANAVRLGVNGLIWNHAGDDAKVMGFPHVGGQNSYRGPYGGWRDYWAPKSHSDHVHVEVDGSPYIAPAEPGARPVPTSGEVYVDKLTAGQTDSDSVSYVQLGLAKVLGMVLPMTGTYDSATVAAAKEYQRRLGDSVVDGLLGPLQTLRLFKDAGLTVKVFRSSTAGGLVTDPAVPAPKPPATPAAARFEVPTTGWDERSYLQGLAIHKPSGTSLTTEADKPKTGEVIDVHARTAAGKYLGKARVGNGHGSTVGLESTGTSSCNLWFRDVKVKATCYAPYRIGQTGTLSFVKVPALPYGDPSIDQAADLVCVRLGNRFRGYRLSSAKAGKTVLLFDFTIPAWGKRFQGHLVFGGRLFVHRDVATKSTSKAHVFDFTGRQLAVVDTTKWGDEAEGFVERDGTVYAVKRTGNTGPSRVIVASPLNVKATPASFAAFTPPRPRTLTTPRKEPLMDTTKALEFIPARHRQLIYVLLIVASLLLTAAAAVYAASPFPVPWWVGGGLAGLGVLAAPFGVLAASNVKAKDDTGTDIPGEAEEVDDDENLPVAENV